jgi:hypothetical protein
MSQPLFDILDTITGRAKIQGKVLRYEKHLRLLVVSDGRIHFYANLAQSADESVIQESQLPCWFDTIVIEFIADSSFTENGAAAAAVVSGESEWLSYDRKFVVRELVVFTTDTKMSASRRSNEVVLTTPWNLLGPTEINAAPELLRACVGECVGILPITVMIFL